MKHFNKMQTNLVLWLSLTLVITTQISRRISANLTLDVSTLSTSDANHSTSSYHITKRSPQPNSSSSHSSRLVPKPDPSQGFIPHPEHSPAKPIPPSNGTTINQTGTIVYLGSDTKNLWILILGAILIGLIALSPIMLAVFCYCYCLELCCFSRQKKAASSETVCQ